MDSYRYRIGDATVTLHSPRFERGRTYVSYRFRDKGWNGPNPVFTGDDFGVSPLHCWDSPDAALALLSFLTVGPGEVDGEYLVGYTPEQLRWVDERAEEFNWLVHLREEARARKSA